MTSVTVKDASRHLNHSVLVAARRTNGTYKSKPEWFGGRLIAVAKVLGTYKSQPYALVLERGEGDGGPIIITLSRIVAVEDSQGKVWYDDGTATGSPNLDRNRRETARR